MIEVKKHQFNIMVIGAEFIIQDRDTGETFTCEIVDLEKTLLEKFGPEDAVNVAAELRAVAIHEENMARAEWMATDAYSNLATMITEIETAKARAAELEKELNDAPARIAVEKAKSLTHQLDQSFRRVASTAHQLTGKKGKELSDAIASIAKTETYTITEGKEAEAMQWALAQYEAGAREVLTVNMSAVTKILKAGAFYGLDCFTKAVSFTVRMNKDG